MNAFNESDIEICLYDLIELKSAIQQGMRLKREVNSIFLLKNHQFRRLISDHKLLEKIHDFQLIVLNSFHLREYFMQ